MENPSMIMSVVQVLVPAAFIALILPLVVVAVRRPREAGAWWPAVTVLAGSEIVVQVEPFLAGPALTVVVLTWTVTCFALLAQTQLYLLRQRMDVHRLSAWVDRATVALVLVTIASATVLAPLQRVVEESGSGHDSALVYITRPALGFALLVFTVAGTTLTRGWGDRRSRALFLGFLAVAVGDTIGVTLTLAQVDSLALYLVYTALQVSLWFFVIAAARAPAPTGGRLDEDAPAVLLIPAAALVTSVVVLAVDHVSPLPTPAVVAALATLLAVGVKVTVTFSRITALNATKRQARTDELTGLANRRALTDVLAAVDSGSSVALALVDLDRFKQVNDVLGHAAGDELLRQVSARMLEHCRPQDLVARQGGDEFAVVLEATSAEDAAVVAERVTAALIVPFVLGAGEVSIAASIGVAATGEGCTTSVELQRRADTAMYRVKAAGGGVAIYDGAGDDGERRGHGSAASELRAALTAGDVVVSYRPRAVADTDAPMEVAAQLRWDRSGHGTLSHDEVAEAVLEAGLVDVVTTLLVDASVAAVAAWRGGDSVRVAIPLLPSALTRTDLRIAVDRTLARTGACASSLLLEVPEAELVGDPLRSRRALMELRSAGIGVRITGFGAAYASLASLAVAGGGELVIDGSVDTAAMRSAVEMARSLGLTVVVPGLAAPDGCEMTGAALGEWLGAPATVAAVAEAPARA